MQRILPLEQRLLMEYDAGNVYMVAAGAANGTVVDVMQDGQPISAADAGSDVHNGKVVITGNKLYNLVKNSDGGGVHALELKAEDARVGSIYIHIWIKLT